MIEIAYVVKCKECILEARYTESRLASEVCKGNFSFTHFQEWAIDYFEDYDWTRGREEADWYCHIHTALRQTSASGGGK